MLLYPGFTAIDLVGPQYYMQGLLGSEVHLVAKTPAPPTSTSCSRPGARRARSPP